MMKKMVVMNVYDYKSKDKVIRTVAKFPGLTTITMDSKEGKLTLIGDFDELKILKKLRKRWHTAQMATYGPYNAKKEAEVAAEKTKEESKHHHENPFPHIHHYHSHVCDHDYNHSCVIS